MNEDQMRKAEKYQAHISKEEADRVAAEKAAKEMLEARWNGAKQSVPKIGSAISNGFNRFMNSASQKAEAFGAAVGQKYDAAKEGLKSAGNAISEKAEAFGAAVGQKYDAAKEGLKNAGNAVSETASPLIKLAVAEAKRPLIWAGKLEAAVVGGVDNATNKFGDSIVAAREGKASLSDAHAAELTQQADAFLNKAKENVATMQRLLEQKSAALDGQGGSVDNSEIKFRMEQMEAAERGAKDAQEAAAAAKKKAAGYRDAKSAGMRLAAGFRNFLG